MKNRKLFIFLSLQIPHDVLQPLYNFAFGELFNTVLPDFILGFAFFTSLCYMVLAKRSGQNRPAVAMSATMGFALAVGLVWWEQSAGLSIRNFGPIAAGFALIVLAGIMYQAIKQVGGSWAGAGIAIGACLIIGWVLGLHWPVDTGIIQTITGVALTVGIIAFLSHHKGFSLPALARAPELAEVRHDMDDLYEDRSASRQMADHFRKAKKEAKSLPEHPQEGEDILLQLKRMLPEEGWLTERLAKLREKIWHLEQGNIERIMELQQVMGKLSPEARQKAAREIQLRCKEFALEPSPGSIG